jgi:hypothetical protein
MVQQQHTGSRAGDGGAEPPTSATGKDAGKKFSEGEKHSMDHRTPAETPLDIALDSLSRWQELEQRLPERSLLHLAVVGAGAGLKEVVKEIEANEKPRKRAA